MKPAPLSPENKAKLIEWLRSTIELVEAGEVSGIAAYCQKTSGGGKTRVAGEFVSADVVYGLNQIVEKIEQETKSQRLKVAT